MSPAGTAWGTTRAVLGAGTLLVPAALAATPGGAGASLLLAVALLAWCLLVSGAGGTSAGGPVAFVARRLGPGAARAVEALYFGGFAAGQAAVAAAAGEFAADGAAARALAGAVLLVAVLAATRGVTLPPWALRARLAAVLALTAAWGAGALSLDGTASSALPLVLPLLFAWVGLEGAVPPPRPGRGATLLHAAAALALPAALYAALLARTPPAGRELPALGWAAAAVLTAYCLTNLRAAGARWATLTPGPIAPGRPPGPPGDAERRGGVLAASLALTVLAVATAADWSVAALLVAPGAATAAIYTLVAVAALAGRRTSPTGRTPMPDTTTATPVSKVARVPAAAPAEAAAHFYRRATFEADVADVHADFEAGANDFVLIDSRSREAWDQGHIPGAVHLPTDEIADRAAELVDRNALVVTYCWGPGCNGATRAAHAFATAGYRVKEMLGGFEYWSREGFPVEDATGTRASAPDPLTAPTAGACGC